MPFINSKISVSITDEQEKELKTRLGQAIAIVPGKSEQWLMVGIDDNYHLYFRGDNSEPIAYVEVSVFGDPNSEAFNELTAEITKIFQEVVGVSGENLYVKYETSHNWGWNGNNF